MNILLSASSFNFYGIVVAAAIAVSASLAFFVALKNKRLYKDLAFDIIVATIIPAIVGARLYYVIFTNVKSPNSMSFADFFNPQIGSFSFYGALMFGLIAILVLRFVVRTKKQYATLPQILDFCAPFLLLGQSICAFFSFINNMSYGQKLPGDKYYLIGYFVQYGVEGAGYYQSTFLLEGLICLLGFSVLVYTYLNSRFLCYNGFVATVYAIVYGAGRLLVESFKLDALYIVPSENGLDGFKASSFFSIVLLCVGIVALSAYLLVATRKRKRLLIYTPIKNYSPDLYYGKVTLLETQVIAGVRKKVKPKQNVNNTSNAKETVKGGAVVQNVPDKQKDNYSDGFDD